MAPADSVAAWWSRVTQDSTDTHAWFELGRAYVQRSSDYHRHTADAPDTTWARAVLDTAERAFASAAALAGGDSPGDSARTYRVFVWGEKAFLAWELGGIEAAADVWRTIPSDVRLLPVLQELGENLLRACPDEGVLVTAGDVDTYAAWYMRFAQGLRTDLLILPYGVWTTDSVFKARLIRDLKLPRAPTLSAFADRRPVCASMGFERPPQTRGRPTWTARPLVWVAGPSGGRDRVPPQDFVFAALRLALDRRARWTSPVVELYHRAAAATPALCQPFAVYGVREEVGCRS